MLTMNKKISVITTVYNVGEYIDKTINSVLSQTFQDWELIVVNDCTEDDSIEKVQNFIDERIKIINNEVNVGAGKSRQVGIDNASGDYIIFLDGDDWLKSDCLEQMYNAAVKEDADIVNCHIEIKNAPIKNKIFENEERFFTYLNNKLIKRSLFEKTNYSPLRLFEDINTLHRLLYLSTKVVKLDYVGYVYNIRPNSLTTSQENMYKYRIYEALAIMENVDFFEGLKFPYKHKYNNLLVFNLYYKYVSKIKGELKTEMFDEIETIRLWCENQQEKIRNKILAMFK